MKKKGTRRQQKAKKWKPKATEKAEGNCHACNKKRKPKVTKNSTRAATTQLRSTTAAWVKRDVDGARPNALVVLTDTCRVRRSPTATPDKTLSQGKPDVPYRLGIA